MTQLTRAAHKSNINTDQPDNNTQFISASRVRTPNIDGADSCFYLLSDDSDNITEGSTNLFVQGSSERSKIGNLPTDTNGEITNLQNQVDALEGSTKTVAEWDASSGTLPTNLNTSPAISPINQGYKFVNSNPGSVTIDGVEFSQYDQVTALKDNPSSTSIAGEWIKQDFTDNVVSVNSKVGVVVLDADDIGETASRLWLTTGSQSISGEKTFEETISAKAIIGYRPIVSESTNFIVDTGIHRGRFVALTTAGALTITIDDSTEGDADIGEEIEFFWQADAGTNSVTFAVGGSQTIISKDSLLSLTAIGSASVLKYLGSDTWALIGDLA